MDSDDEAPMLVEVPSDTDKVVPVTILSGFLGSGKTTLLNHILTSNHGKRIAVIENEFSAGLGIEGMIAKSGVDGDNISSFFELNNGCICCTVKDDLINTLEQLVLHKDRFDYILIETTGMANPGPVISSFWTDDQLGSCLRLDGVVCVVDTANILTYLASGDIAHEVRQQICYADRILINKVDLVHPDKVEEVEAAVQEVNNFALLARSSYSKVNLDFVLATNSYSGDNGVHMASSSQFLQCFPCDVVAAPTGANKKKSRTKPSTSEEAHPKKATVSSTSLKLPGQFDMRALKVMLDALLYDNGAMNTENPSYNKIYRIKGILHIHGYQKLFILQAVHNLFDLEESEYSVGDVEDKTNGENLLIVIGANLDVADVTLRFESCIQVQSSSSS